MNISCVTVTYNRKKLLEECINNVLFQTYPVKEIIVVNNNSSDGTKEYLQKLSLDNNMIHAIHLKKNIGGAGGFYIGIKNVSKDIDYVLLIDDDAVIQRDFLEKIVEGMEEGVFAYSGTVKTNGCINFSHRTRLSSKTFLKREIVPKEDYQKEGFYYDISTFCGLMISSFLINKIGLPMRDYFIWQDDSEYSLRIIKYSKIKNVNQAVLNHKTEMNNHKARFDWRDYYGYRNFIDEGRKHSKHPVVFLLFRYCHHFSRMIYYAIKSKVFPKDRSYSYNCFLLNQQVIKDSWNRKLGVSNVFYPGKKM